MNLRCRLIVLAAATLTLSMLSACADDANDVGGDTLTIDDGLPVVEVEMTDMAFAPASVDVKADETVRLRFHNSGLAVHEAVIGDLAFQEEHAVEMAGAQCTTATPTNQRRSSSRSVRPATLSTPPARLAPSSSAATSPAIGMQACGQTSPSPEFRR